MGSDPGLTAELGEGSVDNGRLLLCGPEDPIRGCNKTSAVSRPILAAGAPRAPAQTYRCRQTTPTRSIGHMQRAAPATSNRFERHLDGLRDHRALGRPVRFYFRRREQLLYLAVGGWNTVFGYAVWAFLQFLLGDHLHYLVVVVLSWPIAVLNAYLGYRYVVFRSRASVFRELPRFSLVYFLTLLVNLALLPIALRVLPLNIYVVQALLTGVVVICSYLAHKYYSFGGKSRGDSGGAPYYDPTVVSKD